MSLHENQKPPVAGEIKAEYTPFVSSDKVMTPNSTESTTIYSLAADIKALQETIKNLEKNLDDHYCKKSDINDDKIITTKGWRIFAWVFSLLVPITIVWGIINPVRGTMDEHSKQLNVLVEFKGRLDGAEIIRDEFNKRVTIIDVLIKDYLNKKEHK